MDSVPRESWLGRAEGENMDDGKGFLIWMMDMDMEMDVDKCQWMCCRKLVDSVPGES